MNYSQFMWPIAEIILYHRYFSFKLSYPITGPAYYNVCALEATYLLPRFLNLMDEVGERTLNLKIAKALGEIQGQMSFK